ncbi:integrin alpha [uncultured Lamprocystis sp.]|jgi:hypothetical protein|uniref:integrin alpha n=1 Tax=uncultured Lamprocystis sp. TaxID=543132 RepID=UPI002600FE45|nr:integrin alpha [uncultured Lamprocystis sp.]
MNTPATATFAYSNIDHISVGNSTTRWVADNKSNLYVYNDFNGKYEWILQDTAAQSQILAVDTQGNAYAMLNTSDANPQVVLYDPSTQTFGPSYRIAGPAITDKPVTSFAVGNGMFWLVQDGTLFSVAGYGATAVSPSGTTFTQVAVGQQDGSVWALDSTGVLYSWDGQAAVFTAVSGKGSAVQALSVVDSDAIYGLDSNGDVYQWSAIAQQFVETYSGGGYTEIQVDENRVLYGVAADGYSVVSLEDLPDLGNPAAAPNSPATFTDSDGITHAIWNQDGQLYYGFNPSGAANDQHYVGVGAASTGIGASPFASGTDLVLMAPASSDNVAQAYWIDSNGQVNTANLSASPYGGFQWSAPGALTQDAGKNTELAVISVAGDQVLLRTRLNGQHLQRVFDLGQLPAASGGPVQLPSRVKGDEFIYATHPSAASSGIPIPAANFEIKVAKSNPPASGGNLTWSYYIDAQGKVVATQTTGSNQATLLPANSLGLGLQMAWSNVMGQYADLTINATAQAAASWASLQGYPGKVNASLALQADLKFNALPMVLNDLFPGAGTGLADFESVTKGKVFNVSAGPEIIFNLSMGADNQAGPGGDTDYFFEVVNPDLSTVDPSANLGDVWWEFQPQDIPEYFETLVSGGAGGFLDTSLSVGVYLDASFFSKLFKVKAKFLQKTDNVIGIPNATDTIKESSNYSVNVDVNLWLFTLSYGINGSEVEYSHTTHLGSSASSVRSDANYEPTSTTHWVLAAAEGSAAAVDPNLVADADISYVVDTNKNAYGAFVGEGTGGSAASLSNLYIIAGTVDTSGQVAWNTGSLQALNTTAGANQHPLLALDGNGNVLITWQNAPTSDANVQTLLATPPGNAYLIYNQGNNAPINLGDLDPWLGHAKGLAYTLPGGSHFASFGQAVTGLGDVNGGGTPDFAMTAPDYNQEQGGAFLVYAEDYAKLTNLTDPGTDGLFLTGQALSEFGYSMANAGDFNYDGRPDFIIGAPGLASPAGQDSGGIYIIYGGTSLFTDTLSTNEIGVLLADNPTYGMSLASPYSAGGRFGSAVSGGQFGRLNACAVGAPLATPDGTTSHLAQQSGIVTVYAQGGVNAQTMLTVTNQTASINGQPLLQMGNSVALPGDVNADGLADLLIGGAGAAIVVFGASELGASLDLASLPSGQGFVLVDDTGSNLPLQVAGIGDINGDTVSDIVVGRPGTTNAQGTFTPGASYVVFGGAALNASVNTQALSLLNGSNGFQIIGAGSVVSSAGDLNGDGSADLIVAEPEAAAGAGVSYIIYGGAKNHIGSVASLNVADVGGSVQGYVINGADASALPLSGSSVSAVGDVNGDGKPDLLVGAPNAIPTAALTVLGESMKANAITLTTQDFNALPTTVRLSGISVGRIVF